MSKREQGRFIRRLLSKQVSIAGINCKVRLSDMFTGVNNAVVVVRKKNGTILAVGI